MTWFSIKGIFNLLSHISIKHKMSSRWFRVTFQAGRWKAFQFVRRLLHDPWCSARIVSTPASPQSPASRWPSAWSRRANETSLRLSPGRTWLFWCRRRTSRFRELCCCWAWARPPSNFRKVLTGISKRGFQELSVGQFNTKELSTWMEDQLGYSRQKPKLG